MSYHRGIVGLLARLARGIAAPTPYSIRGARCRRYSGRDGFPNFLETLEKRALLDGVSFAAARSFDGGYNPLAIAVGDFNGDTYADLAVVDAGGDRVGIHFGRGDGDFLPAVYYAVGQSPQAIATGDFNADGYTDLAVSDAGSSDISILLGAADGTFAPARVFNTGADFAGSIATGDFNADGKTDLAVSHLSHNGISVLLGDGDGAFTLSYFHDTVLPALALTVEDFNGDGKLDLAATSQFTGTSGTVLILLGTGDGAFTTGSTYPVGENPLSLCTADFNGDGQADLAVANSLTNTVSILLGHGDGTFTDHVDALVDVNPQSITTADFNHDGCMDLGTADGNGNAINILLGHGDGTFAAAESLVAGFAPRFITTGDFNGDGHRDLVVVNSPSNSSHYIAVALGVGDGSFRTAAPLFSPENLKPVTLISGHLNHDNYTDLITCDYTTNCIGIRLGNGDGTFAPAVNYTTGTDPNSLAIGDVNHDGYADIVVTNGGSNTVSVLIGMGDGTFMPAVNYITSGYPNSVALGDFNGNGRTDIAVSYFYNSKICILTYLNNDTFFQSGLYSVALLPERVVAGDYNGDGITDLAIIASGLDNVSILLFNRYGNFTAKGPYSVPSHPHDAVTGDFNGDGRSDLAVISSFFDGVVKVFFGLGSEGLSSSASYPVGSYSRSITTADYNGDGLPDLAVTNNGDSSINILLGTPDGTFTSDNAYAIGYGPRAIVSDDFNGDGMPDIAVGLYDTINSQYINILINNSPKIYTLSGPFEDQAYSIDYHSLADWLNVDTLSDALSFRVESVASGALTKNGVAVNPGTTLLSSGENWVWTPDADANGLLDAFTVIAWDGTAAVGNPVRVRMSVQGVNDGPGFSANDPQVVYRNAGAQTIPQWAAFTPGPADESAQTVLAYAISDVSNPGLFSVLPHVDADGTLHYTPAPGQWGASTLAVTVQDDGGTDNGGVDASTPQTFTITVVNRAPTVTQVDKTPFNNQTVVFHLQDFTAAFNDPDGDQLDTLQITSLPTHGALVWNGQAVVLNQGISAATVDQLTYTPDADYTGADAFGWNGSDGVAYAPAANCVALNVLDTRLDLSLYPLEFVFHSPYLPSDMFTAAVVVFNDGNIPTGNGAPVTIDFRLSPDNVYDDSDTLLTHWTLSQVVAAHGSVQETYQFTLPDDTPAGHYYIVAKVNADQALPELDDANNTAVSFLPFTVDSLVGTISTRTDNTLVFLDDDGTRVTAKITGSKSQTGRLLYYTILAPPGSPLEDDVHFTQQQGPATVMLLHGPDGFDMRVLYTTPDCKLSLTTAKTAALGDDGRFTLHSLVVGDLLRGYDYTTLGELYAPTTDLNGNLDTTGAVAKITLGDVLGNNYIAVRDPWWQRDKATLTITLGNVTNLELSSDIRINSLTVNRWYDADDAAYSLLEAPSLGTLKCKGDFSANLRLADVNGGSEKTPTLSSVDIQGTVTQGYWWIGDNGDGSVGTIQVRRWFIGTIWAASLRQLSVTGQSGRAGYAGDFLANLSLSGSHVASDKNVLDRASIQGTVGDAYWDITGQVGTVVIQGAVGHDVNLGFALNDVTNIASLNLGDVINADIQSSGHIGKLVVQRWQAGSLGAYTLGTLQTTGRAGIDGFAGDFAPNMLIWSREPVTRKYVLGSANIQGVLAGKWDVVGPADAVTARSTQYWTGFFWDHEGDVNTLKITDAAATSAFYLGVDSIKTIQVAGNLSNVKIEMLHAVDPKVKALGSFTVAGAIDHMTVFSAGNIGTVKAGSFDLVYFAAGVTEKVTINDFVAAPAANLPTISSFTLTGLKGQTSASVLTSSVIIAGSIGTVILPNRLDAVQTDNAGQHFGFLTRQAVKKYVGPLSQHDYINAYDGVVP